MKEDKDYDSDIGQGQVCKNERKNKADSDGIRDEMYPV